MAILDFPNKSPVLDYITLLDEMLPNLKKYGGETFIIYYDGAALSDDSLADQFAHDVVLLRQLGVNVIIVHGGEDFVDSAHKKYNHPLKYVDGDRFIDSESIEITEMSLALINKKIVTKINNAGGSAIGVSGKDANLIEARKFRMAKSEPDTNVENIIDLGFVGEPIAINPDLLLSLEDSDFILVVSPIASGENGETFYIDPATAASVIASIVVPRKLILLSDNNDIIPILGGAGKDTDYKKVFEITHELGKNGDNKAFQFLHNCVAVLQNKVESINVLNGTLSHSLLMDLFTNQRGGVLIEGMIDNF